MRLAWMVALAPLAACGPDTATSACKDSLVAGDLVITEVFADFAAPAGGTGTDDGKEWFEIYNNSDRPVSLKGVTVVHSRPNGDKSAAHSLDDVTLAPGQFFTLGNSTEDLLPAYVDYGFSADLGDFFNTDGGMLALKCGTNEIDSAVYDAVKSGRSRQLTNQSPPDYTLNDDQANWCEAKDSEFEADNFGTPGSDNDCGAVVAGACNDSGTMREVVPPGIGELVITEMSPRPSVGATNGEWFEIKALVGADLNGLGLDRAGDSSAPNLIESPNCLNLAAGEYAVFAKSNMSSLNGGVTNVLAEFEFSLVDTNGDIQVLNNGTAIDAVTWTASRAAKALQLDPDATDAASNDQVSNFCDATTTFGVGDFGTPGAANTQCPQQPTAGQCLDSGTNQMRAVVRPTAPNLVITEYLANPAGTTAGVDAAQEWFEIKNIGGAAFDLNELLLQGATATTYPITSSTCISVPANGYALFAHNTTPGSNGGLPAVDVTFSFSLGNSMTATTTPRIQILNGTTILDTVTWSATTDGKSAQLQPGMTTTTANDTAGNFCLGLTTQQYGTALNYGTPKAVNVCQ